MKTALLLLVSLAFVAIGVWMALTGATADDRATGLACGAFFAACALVFTGQLFARAAPGPDADGVLLIRPDRAQLAILATAGLLMAAACPAIGVLAAADGQGLKAWIIWAGTAFFGAAGLFGLWRLIRLRPMVRLDPTGVTSLMGKGWSIPWGSIRGLSRFAYRGQTWLAIEPDPAAGIAPNLMGRVNTSLGFPPFILAPQGTGLRYETLEAIVADYWERYRG